MDVLNPICPQLAALTNASGPFVKLTCSAKYPFVLFLNLVCDYLLRIRHVRVSRPSNSFAGNLRLSVRGLMFVWQVAVDLHEYEWRYFEGGKKEGPLLLCLRRFNPLYLLRDMSCTNPLLLE